MLYRKRCSRCTPLWTRDCTLMWGQSVPGFHIVFVKNYDLPICTRNWCRTSHLWVSVAVSVRVRWPGHEGIRSPPSNGKVKNDWSYTSFPPYAFVLYTVTSCHCWVQKLLCFRQLLNNVNIRSRKAVILSVVLYWCEMSAFTQGSTYVAVVVSGNRVLSRMRGGNREAGANSMYSWR